jgi:hypothetical protein
MITKLSTAGSKLSTGGAPHQGHFVKSKTDLFGGSFICSFEAHTTPIQIRTVEDFLLVVCLTLLA